MCLSAAVLYFIHLHYYLIAFKSSANIGVTYSGLGPDFRVLVAKGRKAAQAYWLEYKSLIPVHLLARQVASTMQQFTQGGGVRPFGVSLLLCGFDENGSQLYQVDPSGSFWAWKASSIGKNSTSAKTFLEKRYNTNMELEDAINTSILTLKESFEGAITEDNIEIGIVTSDKKFRLLTKDEIKDYIREVE